MKSATISLRSRFGVTAIATIALVTTACTGAQPTTPPQPSGAPSGAPSAAPSVAPSPTSTDPLAGRTVRIGYPSAPDFGNSTTPLLEDAFAARGATFEATNFNTQAEANNALLTGQADFEQTQLNSITIAHNVGTDFQALMDTKANEWSLVTGVDITDPTQLDGLNVGIHGPGTLTELLVNSTIQEYSITPNVLVVPGSDARAAALQAGELDATPADISTVLSIDSQAPGQYHVLIDYNEGMPFLGSVIATRKALIDEDPEFIQAAVDVFSAVQASIAEDPDQLDAAAAEYLPDMPPEEIQARKDAYLERDYWNPSLTQEQVEEAIAFMLDTGVVTEDNAPAPEDISNLTFIQAAGY